MRFTVPRTRNPEIMEIRIVTRFLLLPKLLAIHKPKWANSNSQFFAGDLTEHREWRWLEQAQIVQVYCKRIVLVPETKGVETTDWWDLAWREEK